MDSTTYEQAQNRGRIAERAYQLWENEGRPEGRDVEFWTRAEQELTAPFARSNSRGTAAAGTSTPVPASQAGGELAPGPATRRTGSGRERSSVARSAGK